MTAPIARGMPPSSPSPLTPAQQRMDWGANALAAPTTPARRLPVVDKSKVDPNTLKAAEGMEAMFLDYMMKTMRQTVPKNDLDGESPATEIYRNMMDTENAQRAAHAGGVGLADQIVAYLESQRYNLPQGSKDRAVTNTGNSSTGGTHESQSIGK